MADEFIISENGYYNAELKVYFIPKKLNYALLYNKSGKKSQVLF